MLNLSGIIFAIQFVTLLMVGAYADYGKWRPWVMIGECGGRVCRSTNTKWVGFMGICYCCQFSISALNKPSQWPGAQVCYVVGVYGAPFAPHPPSQGLTPGQP